MIEKWKILNSEIVLNEKWYQVRKDTIEIRPDRIVDDYYLGIFGDIVLIVALTTNQEIPLVRQYKHGAGEVLSELPGGYMNDKEEPLVAAQRELREETGFTAPTWHKLGVFLKDPTKTKGNNLHLFLALDALKTNDQELDDNEKIEVLITPFGEAVAMARNGNIKASDSSLALLLAENELQLP